jgi:hypothetical protein
MNGSVPAQMNTDEKMLPRDILLQKVRQYRENQTHQRGPQTQPLAQQLAMDVENSENPLDAARRLANEIVKSPFDAKNLDIPAFLRRKSNSPRPEDEDNLPLG